MVRVFTHGAMGQLISGVGLFVPDFEGQNEGSALHDTECYTVFQYHIMVTRNKKIPLSLTNADHFGSDHTPVGYLPDWATLCLKTR